MRGRSDRADLANSVASGSLSFATSRAHKAIADDGWPGFEVSVARRLSSDALPAPAFAGGVALVFPVLVARVVVLGFVVAVFPLEAALGAFGLAFAVVVLLALAAVVVVLVSGLLSVMCPSLWRAIGQKVTLYARKISEIAIRHGKAASDGAALIVILRISANNHVSARRAQVDSLHFPESPADD